MLRELPWCALALSIACHPAPARPHEDVAVATMPGPTSSAPASGRVALNDGCVRCHAAQALEWQGSQHRSAYADPDFQRAVAVERGRFCRGCHAPEADPTQIPSAAEGTMGVGCVTCHVPDGADSITLAVLTLPTEYPAPNEQMTPRSPAFSSAWCRWKAMIEPAEAVLA